MTDAESLADLFIGPALIVDDRLSESDDPIVEIRAEIEARDIPVLTFPVAPATAQVPHLRGLSLMVLDWELGAGGPFGVTNSEAQREALIEFIRAVLTELYCPIFVFSTRNPETIRATLLDRVEISEPQFDARVLVKRKADVSGRVFEELTGWLAAHPSMYTLKSWEDAQDKAKTTLFQDLQEISVAWPRILWETSEHDNVNASAQLMETISRNLYHRLDPVTFDRTYLEADLDKLNPSDLRRVLHGQAVLSQERLYPDVIMPGDFFYPAPKANKLPPEVWINLTPACDLVPRKTGIEKVRMYLVKASRIPTTEYETEDALEVMLGTETSTSQPLFFLVQSGEPYRVHFKHWSTVEWGDYAGMRRGRLLDPFITLLQQKNSMYIQRQGLPRVPRQIYPAKVE